MFKEALAQIVKKNWKASIFFLTKRAKYTEDQAQDILQDISVSFLSRPRAKNEISVDKMEKLFRAWVRMSATNNQKQRKITYLKDDPFDWYEAIDTNTPEESLAKKRNVIIANNLIASLTEKQQAAANATIGLIPVGQVKNLNMNWNHGLHKMKQNRKKKGLQSTETSVVSIVTAKKYED